MTKPGPPLTDQLPYGEGLKEQKMEDQSEIAKSMSDWKSLSPSRESIQSRTKYAAGWPNSVSSAEDLTDTVNGCKPKPSASKTTSDQSTKFENWTPEVHNAGCQQPNECNSYDPPQKEHTNADDQPPDKLHPEDQPPKELNDDGHSHKELDQQHIQIQSSEKLNTKELGAHNQPPKEPSTNYNPHEAQNDSDQQPKEFNADSQPPRKYNTVGEPPSECNTDGHPPKEDDNAEKHLPTELYDSQPLTAHGRQPIDPNPGHPLTEPKDNGQPPVNLGLPPKKFVTNEKPPKELDTLNEPPEEPCIDSELPKDFNTDSQQPKELTASGQLKDELEKHSWIPEAECLTQEYDLNKLPEELQSRHATQELKIPQPTAMARENLPHSIPLIIPSNFEYDPKTFTLIERKGNHSHDKLSLVREALLLLESINQPIAVLAICGPYRSGKSHFLSQMLNTSDTFKVGHTMNACTHGVWMATTFLQYDDFALILLDTEGINAVGGSASNNTRTISLLVMTTLLSSYLIYNSQNVPTATDLEKMSCFTQLSSSIAIRSESDVEDSPTDLQDHFPDFLWLLRDVQLEFTDENGNAITPTEYIKGQVLSIESPEATAVLTLFPSLECQTLPHPNCNPGRNPEKASTEFNTHVSNIRRHILQSIKTKRGFNTTAEVDGLTLVDLAKQYTKAINTPGTIPSLEFSWLAVVDRKLTALADELLTGYVEELESAVKDTLPLEVGSLDDNEQPPKTLLGIHQSIYCPKFNLLRDEFTRLVPMPANTSREHESSETKIRKDFLLKFEHQIAQYDHTAGEGERSTLKVVGGILFKYTEQNHRRSQEQCEKLFDELYVQQQIVKLGWLQERYWDKAVGPAKDAVYQNKAALIPGPPQNFQSSEVFHNCVTVTWNEPTVNSKAAKRYEIEIQKHSEWVQSALSEKMSAMVADLNPNTNYCFRVRAINPIRKGEYSEELNVMTAVGPPNTPSKPKLQVVSPATAIICAPKLSKEDENGSPVTHIIVERCSQDSDKWQPEEFLVTSCGVAIRQEIYLESALRDTIYYFRIRMTNSGGVSKPSDAIELTVSDLIPGPPQNLFTSRIGANQIDLMWDEPSLHPKAARSYEVEKQSGGTGWSLLVETSTLFGTVTDLKPNTEYYFRVCARHENRRGEYCEVLKIRTAAGVPCQPLAPVIHVVSPMKATISVQALSKADENGRPISHIVIECCSNDGQWNSKEYPIKPNISVIKQEVTLENDKLQFRVRMKSEAGVSSPSAITEVRSIDLIPGPPQNLFASRSSADEIDLKWDEPSLHPKAVQSYEVQKKSGGTGWSPPVETSSLYENVADLKPNTEYYFRVCARHENRRGEYTEALKTRTAASAPCQPKAPMINVVSSMKATISVQKLNEKDENGSPITHVVIESCSHDGPWSSKEYLINPNISVIKQEVTLENDKLLFQVRMKSEAGVSIPSDITEVRTIDLIPGPPQNLEIVGAQTHDCSKMSWEKPIAHPYAVKNYVVEMHKTNAPWVQYAVLEEPHVTLNDLTANTKYWFRVCALNEKRKGDYSEELVMVTPPGPPCKPSKPETIVINPRQAAVSVPKLRSKEEGGCSVSHIVVDTYSKAATDWSSQEFPIEENIPLIQQEVGLEDSTRYFRVRMKSNAGISEPSDITEIPINDLPPGSPQNVRVVEASYDRIKLSWNLPCIHARAAKSYLVQQYSDCNGWNQVAIFEGLSAEVLGLKSNSKYWFRVCARSESRIGEFCDNVEANTTAGPPNRPSKPTVQVTPTQALISLQRLNDDENGSPVTHIIVERRSQSTTWIENEFPVAHGSTLFRGEIPLDNAMEYFRVKMKNQIGVSEPSETAQVATTDLNPGPPQNFRVVEDECKHDRIKFTWDKPAIHPVAARSYELEQRSENTEWKHALLAENMYAFATDLSPDTKYWFRICAKNETKKGEYSEAIEGTTLPGPPKQPQKPSIEALPDGKVKLTVDRLNHKDQHGSPVESIRVERCSDKRRSWTSQEFCINPSDVIIEEVICLDSESEDTTYYFQVSMINKVGISEPSDVVQISAKDLIPGSPKSIRITERTHKQITLKWEEPDTPLAAKHYEVQKRVRGGGWTDVGRYDNTCAIVRDLQTDTQYKFRVRALNANLKPGEYTITEDCTLDLTPGQLRKPRIVGYGQDRMKIRWNKPTDNPTAAKRYNVQIKGGRHHDWEQVKSTRHLSAVIDNLESNEMYSFRLGAENMKGEKGQFSEEVSAYTKRSQGIRVAMAIISGIAGIFPGFLAYHASGPVGDLDPSDDEREDFVTSV